ncbi:hypothetical protein [Rhodococcus chondri]|uniref:Integrase n=1 Tax=Rhodococcus chondri TaxID=3065941 RepID=A0ABU7JR79_9NOCA|nr:hypothetical protein [Rhodococcus sp. CC-R104]MEE2032009.1 hypothetical protein [Rhodococcus sp. CC-R104]
MLFASLFTLAGRGKPSRETAEQSTPTADSLRVTASALRAWAHETDVDGRGRQPSHTVEH